MTYARFVAICALLVLNVASPTFAQSTAPMMHSPQATPPQVDASGVLTDSNGMTLYWYGRDGIGTSNCAGNCLANWPPLLAPGDARPSGHFSLITRSDGAKQWAYDGQPLYFWKNDKKPGDETGNGVAGVWHVAKPQ